MLCILKLSQMEMHAGILRINPGFSGVLRCITAAHDLVMITCTPSRLLHNLLRKRLRWLAGTLCHVTVRVISAFGGAYYSTSRSLMSLRLQNHTSTLLPYFFLSLSVI